MKHVIQHAYDYRIFKGSKEQENNERKKAVVSCVYVTFPTL